jgi:hypothetical protein
MPEGFMIVQKEVYTERPKNDHKIKSFAYFANNLPKERTRVLYLNQSFRMFFWAVLRLNDD